MRTARVSYKLFGIDQPVELEEKDPVAIGTLTSEENETLDILLEQSHSQIEAGSSITTLANIQSQCGKTSDAMEVELPCTKVQASTSYDTTQMDTNDVESDSTIDMDYKSEIPTDMLQTDNSNNTTINTAKEKNIAQIKSASTEGNIMTRPDQLETTSHTLPLDKSASELKKNMRKKPDNICEVEKTVH